MRFLWLAFIFFLMDTGDDAPVMHIKSKPYFLLLSFFYGFDNIAVFTFIALASNKPDPLILLRPYSEKKLRRNMDAFSLMIVILVIMRVWAVEDKVPGLLEPVPDFLESRFFMHPVRRIG